MSKKKKEVMPEDATENKKVETENKPHEQPQAEQDQKVENNPKADETVESEKPQAVDYEAENAVLNDRLLRLNAEFQNYRKRVEKEKTEIFKYGNEKFLIEMLPIMDNFERALSSFEEDHAEDKILSGVKMIKKTFDDFFEKNNIKKIECVNQPFDPDKHHAVMSEEVEGVAPETVIEVFQDGYLLGDKVIRPSMVKVSN